MVIDIEITLNRFGFGKIADNKFQLLCFRFSKWQIPGNPAVAPRAMARQALCFF
jgi:hypothetical protein